MFLTEANVLHYLLERRFADLPSVVNGAFHVRNLSRRNRNFRVTCGAREYFIKQPKKWDGSSRRSLDQEAAIYWQAKIDPGFQPLKALVPEAYGYDPDNSVLTLQYLPGQTNLHITADRFSPDLARLAGATMGAFHRDMRSLSASALFSRRKPWYFSIHQAGPEEQEDWNEGRRELLRVIQKYPGFGRALEALTEEWREETVIHGDWKLENCLLSSSPARLQIIDWEFANWGDPFEDIGTILQSWWGFWVRRPSQYGIEEIRPALRAFLEAYAAEDRQDAAEMAPRALRFAAARMLQSAYEALEKAEKLNADAVCLLQAGLNLLSRPEWALCEIFGPGWQ
jgi:Ser/Thr protein kinase RdoA (MazF antagonist)